MAHTYDTTCLYTTLKNVSGKRLVCSFLPPHGRVLLPNETVSILGDAVTAIGRGDPRANRAHLDAFVAAVTRKDLVVVQTPTPVFVDTVTHASKVPYVHSGALGVADPCFANSLT